jgi:phosphohistidine phosphatase
MELYIVRHAWAGERDSSHWPDDDMRPLTLDGKQRFARVARKFAVMGLAPQVIATSPLVRCIETAEILAGALGEPKIVSLDELRPGSDLHGLLRWTARQAAKHQQIAWVGHTPDIDRMAAALIGSGNSNIRFTKGGAAAIRFEGEPSPASGALQWLVTAKILGC